MASTADLDTATAGPLLAPAGLARAGEAEIGLTHHATEGMSMFARGLDWSPGNRIGATSEAAEGHGVAGVTGRIEPGLRADLVAQGPTPSRTWRRRARRPG